jgi:hypothetical protein
VYLHVSYVIAHNSVNFQIIVEKPYSVSFRL